MALPSKAIEAVLPARMGRNFRWLVTSSWVSNLGDGVGLAAGPLLIASQTRDPMAVAAAALLQQLPWLLLVLYAGVLADRLDRRAMVVLVDLARAAVLVVLVVTIATGQVSVPLILVAMFLLGTAEVFADTAGQTLLPMTVDRDDLGIGNARLMAGFLTANQLVGPALGAMLFAAGHAWPFVTQAVCVGLGAVMVSRMRLPAVVRPEQPSQVRRDLLEGLRWTWQQPAVRTLTLTIVTFNVTFGAAWSVLVLWAQDRLGLGAVGFGMLTTVSAIGGIVGTAGYDWLSRRVSLGGLMRVGLVLETLTHLVFATTTSAAVALTVMFVFGAHAFIWGTTSRTIRMRSIPNHLQGRVTGIYSLGVFGGMVAGRAVGGLVADWWGLTGPFWFAFVGSALLVVLVWRSLSHVALD